MAVDGAILGLPDPTRHAAAMAVIDDAMVVSSSVEADLRACGDAGRRVAVEARAWRQARGVACAAAALLSPADTTAAAEARLHLQSERDARAQRLLTHLQGVCGDLAHQLSVQAVIDDATAPPVERAAARAVLLRLGLDAEWQRAIDAAATPWAVALMAEAAMAGAASPQRALMMVGPVRRGLVRVGMSHSDAFALARDFASRVGPCDGLPLDAGDRLDAAAVVGAAAWATTPETAAAWLAQCARRDLHPLDVASCLAARGRILEAGGDLAEAMQDWRAAAELGGQAAGGRWDRAARGATTRARQGDGDQAREVLALAARFGDRGSAWLLTLAAIEAQSGEEAAAIERLRGLEPGGQDHLEALSQIGSIVASRRARVGGWSADDAVVLQEARAAAMAAAHQQRDVARAAAARPVAAELAAVLLEHALYTHGPDVAATRLEDDPAVGWMPAERVDHIRLRLAVARRDWVAVASLAADGEAAGVRDLLWRCRSLGPEDAARLIAVVDVPAPAGSIHELLGIADLLVAGGDVASAVQWYDAVLAIDATLLPAILGRCECLRHSGERAVLADVAEGYRQIAALPRDDDPDRWRMANLRLIEVLRRAGVDPSRLDAKLARLRAIDPELGVLRP